MRSRSRGQSMVEFALVFPILLLILMGLFDFGRAIVAYNTVSEAARNGARVSIVNQTPADICAVAASRAVALSLPTTCAPNATAVGVYVTASSGGASCTAINCVQTVKATYQFRAITPIIGSFIGPITLSATSSVPVESTCLNASCPTT
jgi:Flp pilus assembly protein TadG